MPNFFGMFGDMGALARMVRRENLALFLGGLALAGVVGVGGFQYWLMHRLNVRLAALTFALDEQGLLASSTLASSAPQSSDQELTTAVANVAPAVVSIVISKELPQLQIQYENPFGNNPRFRGINLRVPVYQQVGTKQEDVGAGTGFLVRSDGYIITNRHVVDDTEAEYTVLLSTGEQKTATVVYRDPSTDLALIKIDGSGYPTVPLGDSSHLELGQTVAAIGNALGEYNNSVSVGIVSGLDRTVQAYDDANDSQETLNGVIQTDAAINLGNSGGPLFDLEGRAVGVNVVTDLGANSIAFSIPINAVKDLIAKEL
ncbi:MAG TPA: trypsin-like peptidase domain-containing protein [Candidatus Paceibacterota bacterium]|nr:trypsin-like peptidase domain-containing protein [Candidatus Paceibacterota bacterium]